MKSPHTIVTNKRPLYDEYERPVVEVDCKKSKFYDIPWFSLSGFQMRKFENQVKAQYPGHKVVYKTV